MMVMTSETPLQPGDALLIVDVQQDFLPGGSLAVPQGDAVVPLLNTWIGPFVAAGLPVAVTRDWHPADHGSFLAQGGPWPPHCVVDTPGAAFAPGLKLPEVAFIVSKGTFPEDRGYSAFEGTGLHQRFQQLRVRRLFIGGLATDYCILNTGLDAMRLGYEVNLLTDGIRAVNVQPGDGERAIATLLSAGAIALGG
jgi:nicotinamidase/pyrazinamidase